MLCRVCNSQMDYVEKVYGCRLGDIQFKDSQFQSSRSDVEFYKCPSCTHMQIRNLTDKGFYDNYNNEYTGNSQYYQGLNLTEEKIARVLKLAKSNNKMIEVGCGIGNALEIGQKYFRECIGVEPSRSIFKIAEKKGLKVINGYFNKELKLEKGFSAAISMQVFEHLEDIYSVLEYIYEVLEDGGVGLINVPNGQLIYQNNYYHQITLEHINYFTPFSLMIMAQKVGFEVIELVAVDDTLELDLYISKKSRENSFNIIKANHIAILESLLKDSNTITIWGAGAKAETYGEMLPKGVKVYGFIDSDPRKANKYMDGINVPITNVCKEKIDDSDTIIIFATAYKDEIIEELKSKYGYKGKIIFFEGEEVKYING